MRFTFRPMSETDAQSILAWCYDGPYAIYNMEGDEDTARSELLDPRSPYVSVRDEHGNLAGFFAFGTSAEVGAVPVEPALFTGPRILSVGLGLRPDLTGQGRGIGLAFVNAGLEYARERFRPAAFRLFVLAFNRRAIRVYERAGFARVGLLHIRDLAGERDFIEMRLGGKQSRRPERHSQGSDGVAPRE
ncbi:MAG TPA: GNAT family protein [Ktedonobacterales bacterium]|nr:GNAT family protein [Ktedonobacterales bacterium]